MDSLIVLAVLLVIGLLVGAVLGWVAFLRTLSLRADIIALRHELAKWRAEAAVPPPLAPEAPPQAEAPQEQPTTAPEPAPSETPPLSEPIPDVVPVFAAAAAPAETVASGSVSRLGLERNLTGRWTIWLGALALALSGVFLVKYSIEQELLGPGVRIAFGLLLGAGFIGVGLRLRGGAAARQDYVPAALAAAGVADLFATIYAAFALYGFIGPLPAFALLAGVAALAVALSLLFGAVIALLGIAGAFVVPALVPSDHPSALALFLYLLIVVVGALAVVRYRGWWWLAHVALAGSALWACVWMAAAWQAGDELVIGAYLAALAAVFLQFARDAVNADADQLTQRGWRLAVWAAAAIASVLMVPLAALAEDALAALLAAFVLMALLMAAARRDPLFDRLAWLAGALAVVLIAAWEFGVDQVVTMLTEPLPTQHTPIPEFAAPVIRAALAFAALIGLGGFAAQWGAQRPGR